MFRRIKLPAYEVNIDQGVLKTQKINMMQVRFCDEATRHSVLRTAITTMLNITKANHYDHQPLQVILPIYNGL